MKEKEEAKISEPGTMSGPYAITFSVAVFKIKTGIMAGQPLGDAVANLTHLMGLDKVAETYTRITGRDCGCEQRREFLNNLSL